MKKTLKSMLALVMVAILCFTLLSVMPVLAEDATQTEDTAVTELVIIDEEAGELAPN